MSHQQLLRRDAEDVWLAAAAVESQIGTGP